MRDFEVRAARKAGISLVPDIAELGWCKIAGEIAEYLKHLSEEIPPWKFWVRPGLRLAAELVKAIRDIKCH